MTDPSRRPVFIGIPSLAILTEILRFVETLQRVSKSAEVGPQPAHKRAFRLSADRPRMTRRAGRKARNVGSFLRKELPDRAEDRSKITQECRLLTLGPGGASDFLRKSAIIRRLRRHLLPKEEGLGTSSCSTSDTKPNPVTLTIYSSPPKAAIPQPSARRAVKPKNPRGESPVNLKNLFPSPLNLLNPGRFAAPFTSPPPKKPTG